LMKWWHCSTERSGNKGI